MTCRVFIPCLNQETLYFWGFYTHVIEIKHLYIYICISYIIKQYSIQLKISILDVVYE